MGECLRLQKELETLKRDMIAEERKNIGLNNGCFFLIFRHLDQAQDALKHQDAFRRTLLSANNSILSEEQKAKYNVAKWRL